MVTYLYHDDVQRQTKFLVPEAPLAELLIRCPGHHFVECVSSRSASPCDIINFRDTGQFCMEVRWRVFVGQLHESVIWEEHDYDISIRSKHIASNVMSVMPVLIQCG